MLRTPGLPRRQGKCTCLSNFHGEGCAVVVIAPCGAGERAAFRAALHSLLVRLACSGARAPALTALLAGHLGCHPVGPPGRCAWLPGALDDVLDALEAAAPAGALRQGLPVASH